VTTDELRRKDHGLGGNTQDLGLVDEHGQESGAVGIIF
jgi:hypothetical protein